MHNSIFTGKRACLCVCVLVCVCVCQHSDVLHNDACAFVHLNMSPVTTPQESTSTEPPAADDGPNMCVCVFVCVLVCVCVLTRAIRGRSVLREAFERPPRPLET